jgi:rhodanese-related sulfurtransferase
MKKLIKFLVASLVAIFAVSSLAACSATESLDMKSVAAVIDVRTPEEFATGHLDGALNFDIQGAEFDSQLSTLDKAADYVIYCRSGNRAGQAVSYMQENGFTGTLTNAGSVADASAATSIAIVQ